MSNEPKVHTFQIRELRPVVNPRTKRKDMAANIRVSEALVIAALEQVDMDGLDEATQDKLVPENFKNQYGQHYSVLWPVGDLLEALMDAPMPAVVTIKDADLRLTDAGFDIRDDGREFYHIDYQAAVGTVEPYDGRKHGLNVRIRNRTAQPATAAAETPVEAAAAAPEVKAPF